MKSIFIFIQRGNERLSKGLLAPCQKCSLCSLRDSTHGPIVAGSLKKENIFVMDENKEGGTIVRQLREQVYGLGTDRILESSYLNIPTTRPNSFVSEIQAITANARLKNQKLL